MVGLLLGLGFASIGFFKWLRWRPRWEVYTLIGILLLWATWINYTA